MTCTPSASCWRRKNSCGRPECQQRSNRYQKRQRSRRLAGHGRIDATPAQQMLEELTSRGYSLGYVAAITGVDSSHLTWIRRGKYRTLYADTAGRILAFTEDHDTAGTRRVDATGTRRRVQALARQGWALSRIGVAAGASDAWAQRLAKGEFATVSAHLAAGVRREYDARWDQHGGSVKVARWAERQGWPPPLAWDDDALDDPDATPVVVEIAPRRGPEMRVHIDDVEWLAETGATLEHAAMRFGVTVKAVEVACRRAGRPDLVHRLTGYQAAS